MFALLAALFVTSLAAAPETWSDALRSGNYARAAQLLHPIVTDPMYNLGSHDPEPARALARLYAQGLGVPRDPIGACSIAHTGPASVCSTRRTAVSWVC
jgi:hypothetical protein